MPSVREVYAARVEASKRLEELAAARVRVGLEATKRRIVAVLGRELSRGDFDLARFNRLVAQLREAFGEEVVVSMQELAPVLEAAIEQSMAAQKALAAALKSSGSMVAPDYRQMVKALDVMSSGGQVESLVGSTLDNIAGDMVAWFDDRAAVINQEIAGGLARGEHPSKIARRIIGPAGDLNAETFGAGAINDEAFSRALARTTINQIHNDIAIGAGLEAGFTHFVNLGISDDRQAPECEAASNMGALTMAEWEAIPVGPATRHINCRCEMVGIMPDDAERYDLLQGRADRPEGQEAPREDYLELLGASKAAIGREA